MKESIFVTEVINSLKEQLHPHIEKIPDMPKFNLSKSFYRFSPPRPYDLFFVFQGKFYAVECKMHKKKQAIPFSIVSSYQVERLMDVVFNGNSYAYILINVRIKREMNKCYAIKITDWVKWNRDHERYLNRKSIKLEYLVENSLAIKWLKNGRWDIKPLLNY
jgi:penicillin-binding protein-related factor A (putative recombinase)